ncbi:MAG: response regulator [Bacteriovoracaceae bacterium]|nr:response regulator [Bacteriovoracaceae bacterium]
MNTSSIYKNYRILVVDDSDFSRSQISELLTSNGFSVCGEAANANEALRLIKEKKPHLVLTDIVMPEMSGIELTEKISTNFQNVGVIMISSLHHEQIVLEAIAAGAVDFINKPINPLQMSEAVEKFLSTLPKE